MCGIAGYRVVAGETGSWAAALPAAVAALAHRGPDDQGIWLAGGRDVGLGHRRLAILDLGPDGHQPMRSRCGHWRMIANGEVYNFRAIRAELAARGHAVRSSGDAEVMLAAFAEWGLDAVDRFAGMFAVALWHEPTRRLHLLRDRLGVKPLFYRWDGRALCFGSELKALRAFDAWTPTVDREALVDYLRYGYIADPRTIYAGVRALPPAHRLTLDAHGGVELQRYWDARDHVGRRDVRSEDALADELEAVLADACASNLIADVPVGLLLSGGTDSSVVAALLRRRGGHRLTTFTIGFDRPAYDESAAAAEVARHLGADHRVRTLRLDDARAALARWGISSTSRSGTNPASRRCSSRSSRPTT
ncbi:MAG: asparagine synthase (glutamine-hydrolyzing) [Candidatus Binatia bacterium]